MSFMPYLFIFQLKWFCFILLVLDQSLALLHVLHINYVSDKTFGLRLKFETFVSAKDKVTHFILTENAERK